MTVTQILDAARNNLNATADTLWSDSELVNDLYLIQLQLARRTLCIENTSTDTSVASTASYTKPTRAIEIWRITFDGNKIQKLNQREVDELTFNVSTAPTGTPRYYSEYNEQITLYPTPDSGAASKTIKYFTYDEPSVTTSSSTLEVPTAFHDVLVMGLTYHMCPKDLGHPLTLFWRDKWFNGMSEIEKEMRRRRRADRMAIVMSEENMLTTNFGSI